MGAVHFGPTNPVFGPQTEACRAAQSLSRALSPCHRQLGARVPATKLPGTRVASARTGSLPGGDPAPVTEDVVMCFFPPARRARVQPNAALPSANSEHVTDQPKASRRPQEGI